MVSSLFSLFRARRHPQPDPAVRAVPERQSFTVADPPLDLLARGHSFLYDGVNRAAFYRFLRDHIPIVSAGVWTWVHLCCTPQRLTLDGDDSGTRAAERIIDELARRIYPREDGDSRGLQRLVESVLLDLFTVGRVALVAHLLPDRSGVSHVTALDPHRVHWREARDGRRYAYAEQADGSLRALPPDVFFFRTLQSDLHRPHGVEPLASIPFVVEIEQRMLEDMARASHNAGTPRLQIRLAPPERYPGEDDETYHERINGYFDRTVNQFRELAPDDNVFTWADVEVKLIGGSGREGTVWKLNREQVIEDVITGLKLFPWALGRSHGTTKNWIFAQYNLLMQIVDTVQQLGADLVEWLARLELRLKGSVADPHWIFAPNQDPFILDRNKARLLEVERVERLVNGGFISKHQGARELGY
ncbi:MAG: hypothetical protein MAG453_00142 [Calditrichaeota bacterium]|nr:hypothetical protein [Calditrichota bacterium]